MKKTVFTIVLASTLLLTACGTSTGKKESETTTATITTSETETTTTAEATTTASEETTTKTTKAESGTPESIATTVGKPDGYPSIEEVQKLLSEKIKTSDSVTPTTMPVYDPYILGFRTIILNDRPEGAEAQTVFIFIFQFDTNSSEYKNLVVGEKFNLTSVDQNGVASNDPQVVTAINGPYVLTIFNSTPDSVDYNKYVPPFKDANTQAIYDAFVAINK